MRLARSLAVVFCASLLASLPAAASHLVTGNGFGFGVVSPETGTVTRFYAHPYSFARPDPKNPLAEGVETANFIKVLGWGDGAGQIPSAVGASADYEEDSHVIHARSRDGEGFVFMPFGLREAALVISWEPGSANAQQGGLHVEWSHPVRSQKAVRLSGTEMQLLKFDEVAESLLLIPLGPERNHAAPPQQVLATRSAWALISVEDDRELEQAAPALAKREIAELEQWRVKPEVHFASEKERHLWRQSEVLLRVA
jgi:hypothetical protein